MKRLVLICLLLPASYFAQSMTNAQALAISKLIWGPGAQAVITGSLHQVGCTLSDTFTVVGQGYGWEQAFGSVDLSINGPHILKEITTNVDGQTSSNSIPIYVCNPPATPPSMPFSVVFLGATGEDFVGMYGQTTPDGTPDWHIQLHGLKSAPVHTEITSPTGADNSAGQWDGPTFDTSGHWVIYGQYSVPDGDLFFEPNAPTPRTFHVVVTYADGTTDLADTQ